MPERSWPPRPEGWPPPVEPDTVWREQQVRDSDDSKRFVSSLLRRVQLWGRVVEIDVAGDVFCLCCWRCVPVRELGTPGNGHFASPVPSNEGRVRSFGGPGNPPCPEGPRGPRGREVDVMRLDF